MSKKVGEIPKPAVENFKKGRKLYFVPLVFGGKGSPDDYRKKLNRYWEQAEKQIGELEFKLGPVAKIYHELLSTGGKEGIKTIKELNKESHKIIKRVIEKGGQLIETEDKETLTEFMDWSRCLAIGLQNQKVISMVSQSYIDAGKKRNESIAKRLDETLGADEIGIMFMREGHQVQFPSDIQVFYVAPPALDEINRWLRDYKTRKTQEANEEQNIGETPE